MRIRLITRKDMDEIAKLFVLSSQKESKAFRWTKEIAEKYILKSFRTNRDLCFVMTDNNKIIAAEMCILEPFLNKMVISSQYIVVHPDFRKKRVATKLIRKLVIKAENKYGIEEIETSIYSLTNFPLSWYESIGFREKKHYTLVKGNIKEILKNT